MRRPTFALALFLSLLLAPAFAFAEDLAAGDLDGDGRLTLADLKTLAREQNTLAAAWRGDVTADGRIDPDDVRALARAILDAVAPAGGRPDVSAGDVDRFIGAVMRDDSVGGGEPSDRTIADVFSGGTAGEAGTNPGAAPSDGGSSGGAGTTAGVNAGDGTPFDYAELKRRVEGAGVALSLETLRGPAGADPALLAEGKAAGRELARAFADAKADFSKPAADVKGVEAEFPPDLAKVLEAWRSERGDPLTRSRFELDIAAINARRRRGADGATPVDWLKAQVGVDPATLAPADLPDPVLLDKAGDPAVADRAKEPARDAADALTATGEKEFLPRAAVRLFVDPRAPGRSELFKPAERKSFPMDDEYRAVSVWAGMSDAQPLSPELKKLSDDALAAQLVQDLANGGGLEKGTGGGDLVTRAEALRVVFNPSSAFIILTGGAAKLGLAPESPYAKKYMEIFEEKKEALVSSGLITPQAAQAIEQVPRQIAAMRAASARRDRGSSGSDADGFLDAAKAGLGGAVGAVKGMVEDDGGGFNPFDLLLPMLPPLPPLPF